MSGWIASLRAAIWGRDTVQRGDTAPRFALRDETGRLQRLDQYRGSWVVLYFYPKDSTPACTREACNFRDHLDELREEGAEVLGVSTDSPDSHRAFAVRYALNFPLLSDPGGSLSQAYGSLFRLGPIRFARRRTFLIDPDGRIARVYHSVDVTQHSAEIINDLRILRTAAPA